MKLIIVFISSEPIIFLLMIFCEIHFNMSANRLKLGLATSGNQASCSMRPLRKQLCCTLSSLFFAPARVLFRLLSLFLLSPV